MVTGRRAFARETPADTISAILNADVPDLDTGARGGAAGPGPHHQTLSREEARAEIPLGARPRLCAREQSPAGRHVPGAIAGGAVPPRASADVRALRFAPIVLLTAVLAWRTAAGWLLAKSHRRLSNPRGSSLPPSPMLLARRRFQVLSPDGTTILYVSAARGSARHLFAARRRKEPRRDRGRSDTNRNPPRRFRLTAPGSRSTRRDETGGIFIAGATGESVRRVTDSGFHPAWSPDGNIAGVQQHRGNRHAVEPPGPQQRSGSWRSPAAAPRKIFRRRRGPAGVVSVRQAHRLLEQHRRAARHLHDTGSGR